MLSGGPLSLLIPILNSYFINLFAVKQVLKYCLTYNFVMVFCDIMYTVQQTTGIAC